MNQSLKGSIDYNAIRSQLIDERDRLRHQIDERSDQSQDSEHRNRNRGDLASDYFTQERQFALRSVEVQKLEQIEDALQRVNEGSYGRCVGCNEPIAEERLAALPSATLCMACQTK